MRTLPNLLRRSSDNFQLISNWISRHSSQPERDTLPAADECGSGGGRSLALPERACKTIRRTAQTHNGMPANHPRSSKISLVLSLTRTVSCRRKTTWPFKKRIGDQSVLSVVVGGREGGSSTKCDKRFQRRQIGMTERQKGGGGADHRTDTK